MIRRMNIAEWARGNSVWVTAVVLVVAFSAFLPTFRTVENVISTSELLAITGVVALGETLVLLQGGFDLSVGQVLLLGSAFFGAAFKQQGWPWEVALVGALAMGGGIGVINGLLATKVKLNAFLATFAMGSVAHGIALLLGFGVSSWSWNPQDAPFFSFLGQGYLGDVPMVVFIFIIFAVIFVFLATRTSFGRAIYASGGNATAARMSGINVDRVRILTYIISGVLAALSGLIQASHMGIVIVRGDVIAGFDAIMVDTLAAVMIGGISILGGVGTMRGLIGGLVLVSMLSRALSLAGVDSNIQLVSKGALIVGAAMWDIYLRRGGLRTRRLTRETT